MRRVLLVEDSASMRAFVRAALTSAAALGELEVVEAQSGFDALRLLPRGAWDLVITDINMPRMDGFGLIEALRNGDVQAGLPILVLTTEASDEKKARARSAGATGWIVKPFDREKLGAAIRRVLH